jgi:hypothetical protein
MLSQQGSPTSQPATTLYFGSTRSGGEGDSDQYVTARERLG